MKTLTLTRIDPTGLKGIPGVLDPVGIKTLELPWLHNRPVISCIPIGRYLVQWRISFRYHKFLWRLKDVPGRKGVLVHSGNYLRHSQGCILVGMEHSINAVTGEWEIRRSREAMEVLNRFLGGKDDWTLEIL